MYLVFYLKSYYYPSADNPFSDHALEIWYSTNNDTNSTNPWGYDHRKDNGNTSLKRKELSNTYNTILYAFLFYLGYLIIRNLLRKWKVKIDDDFMFATFPLIVAGGAIRVLEDAGHFEEPLQYFFISPLIYLTLALYSMGALWIGKLIKKVKPKDHKRLEDN